MKNELFKACMQGSITHFSIINPFKVGKAIRQYKADSILLTRGVEHMARGSELALQRVRFNLLIHYQFYSLLTDKDVNYRLQYHSDIRWLSFGSLIYDSNVSF